MRNTSTQQIDPIFQSLENTFLTLIHEYRKGNNAEISVIQRCERTVCGTLLTLDLLKLSRQERLHLLDETIKTGNIEIVKTMTEAFFNFNLEEEIKIPQAENPEAPYRPSFLLPLIVEPTAPKENYQKIADYLFERLEIKEPINITYLPHDKKRVSYQSTKGFVSTMLTVNQYLQGTAKRMITDNYRIYKEKKINGKAYYKNRSYRYNWFSVLSNVKMKTDEYFTEKNIYNLAILMSFFSACGVQPGNEIPLAEQLFPYLSLTILNNLTVIQSVQDTENQYKQLKPHI